MTQTEFLRELNDALSGRLDYEVAASHVNYYRGYFREQTALGKSEEEVCASLQEPWLIAKTILSAEEVGEEKKNQSYFERLLKDVKFGEGFFSTDTLKSGTPSEKAILIIVLFAAVCLAFSVISAVVNVLFFPVMIISVICVVWEQIKSFRGKLSK
ncbi:MAG: DUF1700 domain-containing protein [Parasporobacterium sp.]|nr:DUF1700 domain-containing protein [Parasporobacterium sp.]